MLDSGLQKTKTWRLNTEAQPTLLNLVYLRYAINAILSLTYTGKKGL